MLKTTSTKKEIIAVKNERQRILRENQSYVDKSSSDEEDEYPHIKNLNFCQKETVILNVDNSIFEKNIR